MVDGIFKTNNSMEIFNIMDNLDLLLKKKTNGENKSLLVKNTNKGEKRINTKATKTFVDIKGNKGLYFVKVLNCNTGSICVNKVILN